MGVMVNFILPELPFGTVRDLALDAMPKSVKLITTGAEFEDK